ncbi:hypothetical protein K8R42_02955 [bacterium]|nr:hypothetical protein [bacterium]
MNYKNKQKQLVREIIKSSAPNKDKVSFWDLEKDYSKDNRLCLTSVIFLSKKTVQKITRKVIEPLKAIEPEHYYYQYGAMHATLKSIRRIANPVNFSQSDIKKVDQLYSELIPQFKSYTIFIEDLIKFSPSLSLIGYTDNNLSDLVNALDQGLKNIGVFDDKNYFSQDVFFNNISVCRFTHQPGEKFLDKVKEMSQIEIGEFKIKKISLINCNLACHSGSQKIINIYNLNS